LYKYYSFDIFESLSLTVKNAVTQWGEAMEIPSYELDMGQSHEFTTLWMVFGGYEITGGVLRRSRDEFVKAYEPIRRGELATELAKLTRGNEAAVIRFAERYGQLGYDQIVGSDEAQGGDPVDWFWRHAETIRICLELTELLQEDLLEKVEPYLRSLSSPEEERQRLQLLPSSLLIKFAAKGRTDTMEIAYREKGAVALARLVRRDLINPNLEGIHRRLQGHGKTERSFFQFSALIEAAYWQLADIVEGGRLTGRVIRCKDCKALFSQRRRGQKFCQAPLGRDESPCAVRARVRKKRQPTPTERVRSII
jgi:hypothetical protein